MIGAVKWDFLRDTTHFGWVVIGAATKSELTFKGNYQLQGVQKKGW